MDNFEPKVDSQFTVKSEDGLRLWLANNFARIKEAFWSRRRMMQYVAATMSTSSISSVPHVLYTFVLPKNNFISISHAVAILMHGTTASTTGTKSLELTAGGVKIGQVIGLGGANNSFRLSIEMVVTTTNGQKSFGCAIVTGTNPTVGMISSNIDFSEDVTFSVIAHTSSVGPAEIVLQQFSLAFQGKVSPPN